MFRLKIFILSSALQNSESASRMVVVLLLILKHLHRLSGTAFLVLFFNFINFLSWNDTDALLHIRTVSEPWNAAKESFRYEVSCSLLLLLDLLLIICSIRVTALGKWHALLLLEQPSSAADFTRSTADKTLSDGRSVLGGNRAHHLELQLAD